MKRALIVINEQSGGYSDKVRARIERANQGFDRAYVDLDGGLAEAIGDAHYDLLVVAGGDGTLRSALNKLGGRAIDLMYVPCGTLNERAKARRRFGGHGKLVLGRFNEEAFTYVLAAGSFTPIGYVTEVKAKKRFGRLAYLAKVIGEYKVHAIEAAVTVDGERRTGEYTLVMVIKCDRCFGFRFNRMYDPTAKNGHILLINAPKNKGFGGKIRMFFPFFRAFFLGFRAPYQSKNMSFLPFENLSLSLSRPCDFDVDGEKVTLKGRVKVTFEDYPKSFAVFD